MHKEFGRSALGNEFWHQFSTSAHEDPWEIWAETDPGDKFAAPYNDSRPVQQARAYRGFGRVPGIPLSRQPAVAFAAKMPAD